MHNFGWMPVDAGRGRGLAYVPGGDDVLELKSSRIKPGNTAEQAERSSVAHNSLARSVDVQYITMTGTARFRSHIPSHTYWSGLSTVFFISEME